MIGPIWKYAENSIKHPGLYGSFFWPEYVPRFGQSRHPRLYYGTLISMRSRRISLCSFSFSRSRSISVPFQINSCNGFGRVFGMVQKKVVLSVESRQLSAFVSWAWPCSWECHWRLHQLVTSKGSYRIFVRICENKWFAHRFNNHLLLTAYNTHMVILLG